MSITPQNINGDPDNSHMFWHRRHDDEIWADGDEEIHIASCSSALDAQHIVDLHNQHLENFNVQKS